MIKLRVVTVGADIDDGFGTVLPQAAIVTGPNVVRLGRLIGQEVVIIEPSEWEVVERALRLHGRRPCTCGADEATEGEHSIGCPRRSP